MALALALAETFRKRESELRGRSDMGYRILDMGSLQDEGLEDWLLVGGWQWAVSGNFVLTANCPQSTAQGIELRTAKWWRGRL